MKQFGVGYEPFSHSLERGLAAQSGLGKLMVVQGDIAMQGLLQIFTRLEVVGLQDVADAAVEPRNLS